VGDGIRTRDTQIHNLKPDSRIPKSVQDLRSEPRGVALHLPYGPEGPPPDLAAVVAAWRTLPEPIRAAILAMVRAASALPERRVSDKTDGTPAGGGR
jgi:hypothetical protein